MAADASDSVEEAVVLRFAQKLAVNEPRFRSGALKKLRRWLRRRSETLNGIASALNVLLLLFVFSSSCNSLIFHVAL